MEIEKSFEKEMLKLLVLLVVLEVAEAGGDSASFIDFPAPQESFFGSAAAADSFLTPSSAISIEPIVKSRQLKKRVVRKTKTVNST